MEKTEALKILENAVEKVDAALDAIDTFAEENGIHQEAQKAITMDNLIEFVAQVEDICCHCTAKALYGAFKFLRENNLAVIMEEEEDDE